MNPSQVAALRRANADVNTVKATIIRIYGDLAAAGCEREAETLRIVCRGLEDRQVVWARRISAACTPPNSSGPHAQ